MTTPQEAARTALAEALWRSQEERLHGGADGLGLGSHEADAGAILAALQADPDAARAVVALLGGEGRDESGEERI